MTTARYATALTGGGAGALDAKAVATLADGDIAWVATGSVLYVYKFVAAATDAESSPSRIRPDDYATAGVWYLQNVSADYSQMVRNDIDGGDITTSGQVITVTPCSCWDSTRGTFLQTLVNKIWTVPATNNLEVYLFLVRLNNGTIDVKGYSTDGGAASDVGVNITHYRRLHWNKNNGSGVLMPCQQIGNRLDWLSASNRPILTTSLTTSFVGYTISSYIPKDLVSEFKLVGLNVSYAPIYSLDNSTIYETTMYSADGISTVIPSVATLYVKAGSATTVAVHFSSLVFRR